MGKRRDMGPSDDDDPPAPPPKRSTKESAKDAAADLKRTFDQKGIEGLLSGLAPIVQKAVEAGSAAAAAGMAAVDRARETVAGIPCSKCDARVPLHAKFCMECGAPAPRERRCGECATALEPGAKFCPECGAKTPVPRSK